MTKTKILRCTAPGCRTLTRAGTCDKHRAPEPAPSPWAAITAAEWDAAAVKATTMFYEMREARMQREARRADLADLQDGAGKMFRRLEVPTFSHVGERDGV